MKENEYDVYLNDPGDYNLRISMSRVCEETAGLEDLPVLQNIGYNIFGMQALAEALAKPEVARAIRALQKAGREFTRNQGRTIRFNQTIKAMGFPEYMQGAALTPFDAISHSMRGMRGTITDMYRQPEKLIELCDKILET
jgi:hypothetical protein